MKSGEIPGGLELSGREIANQINHTLESYSIKGYSANEPNRTLVLGRKRLGREQVEVTSKSERRTKVLYFFDWTSPANPLERLGVEAGSNGLRYYRLADGDPRNNSVYIDKPTLDEITYFSSQIKNMPTAPGDIRFRTE
jgi:hypothetical protein